MTSHKEGGCEGVCVFMTQVQKTRYINVTEGEGLDNKSSNLCEFIYECPLITIYK